MSKYQLKEVSKAKLIILGKYFPAWARILGSRNPLLGYVDCFAGAGRYTGGEEGSPLIILRKAVEVCRSETLRLVAFFVEKDASSAERLQSEIQSTFPKLHNVSWRVFNEDAHDFIPKLLEAMPEALPSFFFIDPYGHPLSIPVMNQILSRRRSEILLNLMWYVVNMHLNNPQMKTAMDSMFGHGNWCLQPFMQAKGHIRESEFVDYFLSHLEAEYLLRFRIRFSPEDRVRRGERRTKYYLIHLSNHVKAALLMKEVMWHLGDEMGTFDFSATHQAYLFPRTPQLNDLIKYLRQHYVGKEIRISFDGLREETWDLPFLEKHYRKAIRTLEINRELSVQRVESKRTGIKGKDIIIFGRRR